MARRSVIEITCGRCGRVETQTTDELPPLKDNQFEFQLRFQGKKVTYDDLCRRCRRTLVNYAEKITAIPPKDAKSDPKDEVKSPASAG